MGKFIVKKDKKGEFRFNLHSPNGQVILTSEGYTTKHSCLNGIESVKNNAVERMKFDQTTSSNGKFYFNLHAANGAIIGTSQMYESKQSCEHGIESVASNAPIAEISDESN